MERRLEHGSGEAQPLYAALRIPARVGIEASGYARWFESMLAEQGHELWIGDASAIRAARVRQQKTDARDAQLLLQLLTEDRFAKIGVCLPAEREVWQLLRQRDKRVRLRTSVRNQWPALAMGAGLCRKKKLWTQRGRQELESLTLGAWASRRRGELLEMLDRWNGPDAASGLDPAVVEPARSCAAAVRWLEQPGVGPVTGLALALAVGPVERFPHSRKRVSYLGLHPREASSGGQQRLGAIRKPGNALVRWLRVEAAQTASRKDPVLRRVYHRWVQRRGRAVAQVALARKWAVRLYGQLRPAAAQPSPPTRTQGSSPNPGVGATRPLP